MELGEMEWNQGVASLGCESCGAEFRVLPGGEAELLQGGTAGMPPGSARGSGSGGGGAVAAGFAGPNLTIEAGQGAAGGMMREASIPLEAGDTIGDYAIRERIGGGSFGAVFRAFNSTTQREVALKVVESGDDSRSEEQLKNEYERRGNIHDVSHVVMSSTPVAHKLDGLRLISMEMPLAEMSFRQWLERRPRAGDDGEAAWLHQTLELFLEACRGVAAMHLAAGEPICHLDLKPENVLLYPREARGGRNGAAPADGADAPPPYLAKVTDLGLARADGGAAVGAGTPAYMAPEQFDGRARDIGPAADVYALGILLFEILDGEPPFQKRTLEEYQRAHKESEPPHQSWWRVWGGHFRVLRPVLDRALDRASEKRFANARDFALAVSKALSGGGEMITAACPKCDHVNRHPSLRECESCGESLDEALFDGCPRCDARVRRDQETCPDCGFATGAHFLQLDRWNTIQRLSESEPEEAMRLLRMYAREYPDKFASENGDSIKDMIDALRPKIERSRCLVREAREADRMGDLRRAIESWEGVRKLFASHRHAVSQIEVLGGKVAEVEALLARADGFLREARFEAARHAIRDGIERFAGMDEFQPLHVRALETEKRHGQLAAALDDAITRHAAEEAETTWKALRGITPDAPEVKRGGEWIEQVREQVRQGLAQYRRALRRAEFAAARVALEGVMQVQSDLPERAKLGQEFQGTKQRFDAAHSRALQAHKSCRWKEMDELCGQMLEVCPDSEEARNLAASAREAVARLAERVQAVGGCLRQADFAGARKLLPEIEALAPSENDAAEQEQRIKRVETEYRKHFDKGVRLLAESSLKPAAQAFRDAMKSELCPESAQAQQRQQEVRQRIDRARHALEQALQAARGGDFVRAEHLALESSGLPGEEREAVLEKIRVLRDKEREARREAAVRQGVVWIAAVAAVIAFVFGLIVG